MRRKILNLDNTGEGSCQTAVERAALRIIMMKSYGKHIFSRDLHVVGPHTPLDLGRSSSASLHHRLASSNSIYGSLTSLAVNFPIFVCASAISGSSPHITGL